jgi:eukaryotic-like serine/threonine-protein kinase
VACLLLVLAANACGHEPTTGRWRACAPPPATEMVTVPAGPFTFGDNQGAVDAKPAREVTLASFSIDKYAVTAAEYACCLGARACDERDVRTSPGEGCTLGAAGKGAHPINCVTYGGARSYCEWVGRRLPTEQQWEKTARGASARTFPWGEQPPHGRANCLPGVCGENHPVTAPVAAFGNSASPHGAVQLAGNVWQWVDAWYRGNHDGEASVPVAPRTWRVLRGGSWREHDDALRTTSRHYLKPGSALHNVGFRCAR